MRLLSLFSDVCFSNNLTHLSSYFYFHRKVMCEWRRQKYKELKQFIQVNYTKKQNLKKRSERRLQLGCIIFLPPKIGPLKMKLLHLVNCLPAWEIRVCQQPSIKQLSRRILKSSEKQQKEKKIALYRKRCFYFCQCNYIQCFTSKMERQTSPSLVENNHHV